MSRQLNESDHNNCSSLRLGAPELGQGLGFRVLGFQGLGFRVWGFRV